MKVVEDRVAREQGGQEFVLYAKLEIDPGEHRAMPSECLRQALLGSFARLTEALAREFESRLGEDFRLINLKQFEQYQGRRFAAVWQVRADSTPRAIEALSRHWLSIATAWVHVMGLEFPSLRGSTSVHIARENLTGSGLAVETRGYQA